MRQKSNEGKRVFFVYPHSVFQDNLIQNLVDLEYEIYLLKDHNDLDRIIRIYPDAVIFLNIDRVLSREQWERFIRDLLGGTGDRSFRLGIISYEFEKHLAELYLMDLALPCGYIQLKQSLEGATEIIAKTLEANEVRGRRKFVRCQIEDSSPPRLNVKRGDALINGTVQDLSSAGMSVMLEAGMEFEKNSLLKDVQLNLGGKLLRISAVVVGFRELTAGDRGGWGKIFVLVFDKGVTTETRGIIRRFVHRQLQAQLEHTLKQ